ncbi:MAG: urease accessory protein UreD [Desulfovibrio sp.]|jgi:urease accessory protein|nr:urease accessory protein UreD [Desulfovibrio sp.]
MHDQTHAFTSERRWPATLACSFSGKAGRTSLSRLRFSGPLRVQRLFYPEKKAAEAAALPCHCCLLHPPGGMVSGDSLDVSCRLEDKAHCLLTTPAAGKIYRADARGVKQRQSCAVYLEDGVMEWLPQENIVFNGARVSLRTVFRLRPQSRLIGWDLTCLGRGACGEKFSSGEFVQSMSIYRDETPLLHERLELVGGEGEGPALLRGGSVLAVFYACGRAENAADAQALKQAGEILQALCEDPGCGRKTNSGAIRAGATLRRGVLIARGLGADAALAKRFCLTAWKLTRPLLLRLESCAPRIWGL